MSYVNVPHFHLYTQLNRHSSQQLQSKKTDSIANSNFNALNPVVIYILGWTNDLKTFSSIRKTFTRHGPINFIAVDWSYGTKKDYFTASYLTESVGNHTARFIEFLIRTQVIPLSDFLLVGYSLGAHAVGSAGKYLGGQIGKIVALEPPIYTFARSPMRRLQRTDAKYVQVVHTDTRRISFAEPMGHADFYVNYGHSQPGCSIFNLDCKYPYKVQAIL